MIAGEGRAMLKLLTLKGALTGSAVLDTAQSGTGFELRCRGGLKTLRQFGPINVYLVSDAGISKAECEGMRGRSELPWAGGLIIIGGDGKTVCAGSNGLSPKALENAKASIRLRTSADGNGIPKTAASGPDHGKKEKENPPPAPERADISALRAKRAVSPVTERILDSAKILFAREAPPPAPENGNEERPADEKAPSPIMKTADGTGVRNPFPRQLPGAEWRLAADGRTLEGTAVVRGARRKLTAFPCGAKPKPDPFAAWVTRMRGRGGRIYTVIFEKIQ